MQDVTVTQDLLTGEENFTYCDSGYFRADKQKHYTEGLKCRFKKLM